MKEKAPPGKGQGAEPDEDRVAELAARAGKGDGPAFEELVGLYWNRIFRLAFYRTSLRPDAEELTQDIFMRAYRNISRLKEPRRFKPWLYRIGINRIRDHYRRKKVRSILTLFSESENPERLAEIRELRPSAQEDLEKREFWERVGAFMEELPQAEQEVFRLRFMDQLTLKETAQALGKHESTVKTHLYRAVNKLKQNHNLVEALR